jgi:hypothetical protein
MSKKSPEPAAMPQTPGLAIHCQIALSPETGPIVDEFHRECCEWEDRVIDLQGRRHALAKAAMTLTLEEIIVEGRKLDHDRQQLQNELVALRWERVDILPLLLPIARQAAIDAKTAYEATVEDEFQRFAAAGALDAMPGGQSPAGQHQLRHRVKQELCCLTAQGELNRAEAFLESMTNTGLVAPSAKQCRIEWESTGNSLVESILAQTAEAAAETGVSFEAMPIREAVGLQGAPLLPEHVDTLERIVSVLGIPKGGTGYVIKFRCLRPDLAQRIVPLVEKLPATAQRNNALRDLANCAAKEYRTDGAATHYIDEQKSGFRQAAEAVGST